jgi:superfamily I DNA and RNA helicase
VTLNVVFGQRTERIASDKLVQCLEAAGIEGTLYLGYPSFPQADGLLTVDALLMNEAQGLVVFDLAAESDATASDDRRSDILATLASRLLSSRELRDRTTAALTVRLAYFQIVATTVGMKQPADNVSTLDDLPAKLRLLPGLEAADLARASSAIEFISTIKPTKRRSTSKLASMGVVMNKIEAKIANLDRAQKWAAIEMPDSPQRIRGLAGSGKTIVLALKAAYMHAQNPSWKIAITFSTRSLYQQFHELVRRFSYEFLKDEPDLSKLTVLHAWGSPRQSGVYADVCASAGVPPITFAVAKERYRQNGAFRGVCDELLVSLNAIEIEPLYDVLLIDEAQDLPPSFFEIAWRATKHPKRIIYAYDELQNLSDNVILPPDKLFGTTQLGTPNVPELINTSGEPRRDIVLPMCYRNSPWTLTAAHAFGIGVYREEGLVQFFDNPHLFEESGYEVRAGELELGSQVTLKRSDRATPDYFNELLQPQDSIQCHSFSDAAAQAEWLADQIWQNLNVDELKHRDILVIVPQALSASADAQPIVAALRRRGITSHLAGVTSSVDSMFMESSIAISHIFRAKGNEAAMVYVTSANIFTGSADLLRNRNSLFTAITRSRAWVRLCGYGPRMAKLEKEFKSIEDSDFTLAFKVPTAEELRKLRVLHEAVSREARSEIENLKKRIASGEISREKLKEELGALLDGTI